MERAWLELPVGVVVVLLVVMIVLGAVATAAAAYMLVGLMIGGVGVAGDAAAGDVAATVEAVVGGPEASPLLLSSDCPLPAAAADVDSATHQKDWFL